MPRSSGSQAVSGTLTIRTPAFTDGGPIPATHTCDGDNASPALSFDHIPREAKTLALIMDDPDVPSGNFTHWTWWNLPPSAAALDQGADVTEKGGTEGTNSYGDVGYRGPCPPSGTHRYLLRLYALDTTLDLQDGASRDELESAMQGHVIAHSEITGTYARA